MTDELVFRSAVELSADLRSGAVSANEVMEAHLRRIDEVNGSINAIVTLTPEAAMAAARAADERFARSGPQGPLHGLPIAHKDLTPTAGVRTTFGSPIYEHFVPEEDSLLVERLRRAGALMLGKTNVPEFGVGSQTFNPIFGATRNPYDKTRTSGGSSGGAAAALAARLVPIADGSDFGGSLRNPASFCNVVGFRPSGNRVPVWPNPLAWMTIPVEGPMGRTVADTALLLSAMAGPDPRSPVALNDDPAQFRVALDRDFKGVRVAWASDFGGLIPVQKQVVETIDQQRTVFEALGATVEREMLDLDGADEVFRVLRSCFFAQKCGPLLEAHRSEMKETVIANTEAGLRLTGAEVVAAEALRTDLYLRTVAFFQRFDFLVLPTVQVLPFAVEMEYVEEIEGQKMSDYLDWMASCYLISATGHPAISVPCGFVDGLPVGLQIVGRHPDDLGLLQFAHAFERANPQSQILPPS